MAEPLWSSYINYYNDTPEVTFMPGSWQYQPYLITYGSSIFYNAIGEHPDYFYWSITVVKQVVSGTSYRFTAIVEPERSDLTPHFVVVEIYQPLEGRVHATRITPV